tara:strand:- start:493 stop:816 length:324 start_codon:yes stop_codon:yes gene_type:complete
MSTTYLTDFFVQCIDEEYEYASQDNSKDDISVLVFWSKFCRTGTAGDEYPDWEEAMIRNCVGDDLENIISDWAIINDTFRMAIWRDIDFDHLKNHIKELHSTWYAIK